MFTLRALPEMHKTSHFAIFSIFHFKYWKNDTLTFWGFLLVFFAILVILEHF